MSLFQIPSHTLLFKSIWTFTFSKVFADTFALSLIGFFSETFRSRAVFVFFFLDLVDFDTCLDLRTRLNFTNFYFSWYLCCAFPDRSKPSQSFLNLRNILLPTYFVLQCPQEDHKYRPLTSRKKAFSKFPQIQCSFLVPLYEIGLYIVSEIGRT